MVGLFSCRSIDLELNWSSENGRGWWWPATGHLTYCSQLWRPCFLKDIANLERIQRRSTKYILCDYTSNYKERLTTLNLLPLMYTYWFDLQDLMLLLKCLKDTDDNINIHRYISHISQNQRDYSQLKLNYNQTSTTQYFYFNSH